MHRDALEALGRRRRLEANDDAAGAVDEPVGLVEVADEHHLCAEAQREAGWRDAGLDMAVDALLSGRRDARAGDSSTERLERGQHQRQHQRRVGFETSGEHTSFESQIISLAPSPWQSASSRPLFSCSESSFLAKRRVDR